jgi:hypothetical protein
VLADDEMDELVPRPGLLDFSYGGVDVHYSVPEFAAPAALFSDADKPVPNVVRLSSENANLSIVATFA